MVYLNRIYTRTGDDGTTSRGDGTRVPKTHPRIAAYGGVDELNSTLGMALSGGLPDQIAGPLREIQNDLFDVGADLCVPERGSSERQPLRVTAAHVEKLECWIDAMNDGLEPLRSFVLPGGTPAAARIHQARAVCRRVEIAVIGLGGSEAVNPQVATYLNRLSDLLFVWARVCNNGGRDDILWEPGRGGGG
jgi:cob(I)alamin adenosyltransferase